MGLFDWLKGKGDEGREVDPRLLERACDRVVEHTDPRLKFLPGYGRRLRGPVARALEYLGKAVAQVPGPLHMDRAAYGSDGRVNALFGSVEQMLDLFSRSRAVQEFLGRNPSAERFCCSLGMVREERRVLGMALKEEMVQREVQQVAVNFSGHWIGVVEREESAVRERLEWRGLESLCISALEQITALRLGDRRLLQQRLDEVLEAGCGLDPCRSPGDRETIRRRLEENARRLEAQGTPGGTLEDYLEVVVRVLSHADRYLRLKPHAIRVDRMGIRAAEGEGAEVTTARVQRPGHPPFELVLATFPVAELRDADYYRKQAQTYVNSL